jgi:uncharacterized protein YjiS (DUF1127 family)
MTTIALTDLRLLASGAQANLPGSATLRRARQWLGFAAGVERTLQALCLRLIAWHIRRGTRAALRSLDDRTLHDIGLTRGEIESAVEDLDAVMARRARTARRLAWRLADGDA